MKSLKDIKTITEDYDYVIKHKEDIVKHYSDIFVDLQSK